VAETPGDTLNLFPQTGETGTFRSRTETSMAPKFAPRQGQFLAYIYTYTKIHGRPPAEADLERYFRVSPPAIHQMILRLEELGFISRVPGQGRSIHMLIPPDRLLALE
jgi:DNA-binding MarR family transcriptional regulator